MKIAIIEDNPHDAQKLKSLLNQIAEENKLMIDIDTYTDGINFMDKYHLLYDIVYLDIEMKILNGMTTAEKLRKYDENVIIVFVTNFVQHAIRGYSVNASDFLLKPLNHFAFSEHFKKILYKFERKQGFFMSFKTNTEIKRINIDQILFIESQGHYVHVHTKNEVIVTMDTLKSVEEKLADKGFFRSHSGYIVNLKYVNSVDKNTVKIDKHQVLISRPRRKAFMEALTNYIGDDLS